MEEVELKCEDIKEFAHGHPTNTECGTFSELIRNFKWFK